ncbi:MAG: subtype I-B CRISPR-associated endonuclease Cas1 [Clostridiales bacterium 38-18]|nr:MAG: subtype I-B CRISPR-associated endonuclease Cas1 [Clostridiales bacterium 38-18]
MPGATRYIFSIGSLNRKDNSLTFRTDEGLTHLPIEGIKELYLMNEVSLNTKLLDFLSQHGVVVHFFNYYGHYSGSYYPKDKYLSGRLRVEQAYQYKTNRMPIASAFVTGIKENMLDYFKSKQYRDPEVLKLARENLEKTNPKQNDIKRLLSVEGELWQNFYRVLNDLVDPAFISDKRVKRPPDNPLNAMISFGNSWLYSKTISQLYQTHLDQSISFLHEPSDGRFSLSLDISEVFKLVIVYPVIVTMINKKMISLASHFDKDLNYCYLKEEGRKKFVIELEKKLSSTFEHQVLKRAVSYETAIKLEGYKLSKYLLEGKSFVAFRDKAGY